MKENLKKTSLLYRIIAVVLTFIMVGTTLYFHFEKRYDAKAAGTIEVIQVFLPAGKTGLTDSGHTLIGESEGWQIVDNTDGKKVNTGETGRKYAYIIKYSGNENDLITKLAIEKNDGDSYTDEINNPEKLTIDDNSGEGSREYTGYMIDVDDPASTETHAWKFKYDITINDGETTTYENDVDGGNLTCFNCTGDAVTTEISATIDGDDFKNAELIVGEGKNLDVTITSGSALTALTVLDKSFTDIENTNEITKNYDAQSLTYTYSYSYDFDEENKVGEVKTNKNYETYKSISASFGGTSETLTCTSLLYDATKPNIEETNDPLLDENKIYNGYAYSYSISNDTGDESEIVEAYYKINGGDKVDILHSLVGTIAYIPPSTSLADGTTIDFYAKDAAGNEQTKHVKIVVDNTPPQVSSVVINKNGTDVALTEASSYYFKPTDVLTAMATDNIKLKSIVVKDGTENQLSRVDIDDETQNYSKPLYEVLNSDAATVDGDTYTINVYSYDCAQKQDGSEYDGNVSYAAISGELKIDGTAPYVVEAAKLVYRDSLGNIVDVPASDIGADGIYRVNKENITELYYKVKITDGFSGVDQYSETGLQLKINDTKVEGNTPLDTEYYYFRIPVTNTTYQPIGMPVTYTITAADKAGNELKIEDLTKIQVIDTEIAFINATLKDKATGAVVSSIETLGDVGPYSNRIYTLEVTVTSGDPLTKVGIRDNSGEISSNNFAVTDNSYNAVTKLYSVTTSIDIPADGLNKAYNQLKVFAKDGVHNLPDGKEASIGLLMYDSTLPIVRLGANKADKIVTDNEWHKSFPLSFTVWSGIRDEESPLTIAGYTITGTDAGADVTEKTYSLNGNQNSQADTINIPESNNIGGTTITFRAIDSATNSMLGTTDDPISFTFKVDATNPVIDSLTAAGNEENITPLAGDPSIAAGFSDNLTLGKATFTVSLPDGTTKTYDIADADSEEKNISMSKSFKISEIIGSEPVDGNYKVKLSVEDKAGNSAAEKEIRFAIDNTPPMFTADIVSGSSVKNNSYYNTAVTVRLTIDDNNFDSDKISITDNGQAVSLDNSWQIEDGIRVGTITIPETSEGGHDIRIGGVDTAGLSGATKNVSFIIDKTVPGLELTLNDEAYNEGMGTRYLSGSVKVNAIVTDVNEDVPDLRMQIIKTVPGQEASISNYDPTSEREFTFTDEAEYTLNYMAVDKANNASLIRTVKFDIDNTAPVLNAEIISGASGKENGYYNSDVVIRFTCVDNNFNVDGMSVTDNSTPVNAEWKNENGIWYTDITVTSEGIHNMYVNGFDKAGTTALPRQGVFVIDKTVPTVALLMNGTSIYNESMGTLNLTGPLTLGVSVTDTNEDTADLRVQVIKTVPDTETQTSEFVSTGERTFTFSDEADYTVNIFAVDLANNQGSTRTISFRVVKAAPEISITGAGGGTSASASTVTFSINEAFWMDAKGTVTIKRKAGDGVEEEVYKTINVTPTSRLYSISEVISETGVYKFEFEASDRVGHTATASQTLTVDRNKPEIKLTGVKNYDVTDGEVSISAVITDEFYSNKTVSISGTRTGIDGKKTQISFSPFAAAANPTSINDTFTEDGIYDIIIVSRDIAGNESSSSVHFTIDKTAPVIGDLSMYDGKSFREIDLDEIDLDNLVTDLTVCEVRMYLNGSEYDGLAEIEDGSYTLLITAVDELGHTSEKSVTFVLDTKAPVFIVTGVEDGEIKDDNYNIEVSLQLDEDTLDKVSLNGKDVVIKNNVATVNVTERGKYELYMKAYDEAGNEDENTISFVYGDESVAASVTDDVKNKTGHWWLWLVVAAGILAAGGGILFAIKRRERE